MLLFAPAFFIYLPFISSKDPPAAIFYVKASLFFIILLKIASIVICFIIRCTVLFFKIYEKGISFIEIMKKVLCNFFLHFCYHYQERTLLALCNLHKIDTPRATMQAWIEHKGKF